MKNIADDIPSIFLILMFYVGTEQQLKLIRKQPLITVNMVKMYPLHYVKSDRIWSFSGP